MKGATERCGRAPRGSKGDRLGSPIERLLIGDSEEESVLLRNGLKKSDFFCGMPTERRMRTNRSPSGERVQETQAGWQPGLRVIGVQGNRKRRKQISN